MASNSPTLMQSEERTLEELTSEVPLKEKDYTVCVCISKSISTSDTKEICDIIKASLEVEGWTIDDFDLIED